MAYRMPTPYRHPKTGLFWIKGTVPPDIAARLGKKQYRRSLGTREPSERVAAQARVMLALEAQWTMARQAPQSLTQRQLTALAGEAYTQWLDRYGDDPSPAPWPAIAALMDHASTDPSPAVTFRFDDLEARLRDKGIASATNEEAAHKALASATAQAAGQLARHAKGDYTPDPKASRFPTWPTPATTTAQAAFTLSQAFDLWASLRQPAPATVSSYRSMTDKFIAFTDFDDAHRITRDHIQAWRDHLRSQGKGAIRIRDGYMASLKAILEIAVSEGKLPDNPALKVKVTVPKAGHARSKGFSPEEATMILRAALGPHAKALSQSTRDARRWVPWLCAYTGARVGEITQLRKQDMLEHGGMHGLLITPEAGSTKTGRSRLVPLHPHLIEQGFMTFVDGHKPGPLFTDPAKGSAGKEPHKTRAEKIGAWVRSVGVNDPGVAPNHGWRHLFKTTARVAKLDPEIREYIQGHASRTEGQNYGDVTLAASYPEIVKFPRYNLAPPCDSP